MPRFKFLERARAQWNRFEIPAALALGDAAVAAWLWHALQRFTDNTGSLWPGMAAPIVATPLISYALGLHRFRPGRPAVMVLKAAALGALIALLGLWAGENGWLPLPGKEPLWLGAATAAAAWLTRAVFFRPSDAAARGFGEMVRWLAVGASATFAVLPFYFSGAVGSGDAHWYTVMLSDFITQLRAGVFPVWVGQSQYAFNGAVSPLRYAPGFQYFGGCLDLLTARGLEPTALKNAILAVVAVLGGYSAYACLRPIAKGAPWVAAALSILWVIGPGQLAPLMTGDQYMTFMTLPFAPLALHGCWRVCQVGDRKGALLIAIGLAGLWNCHSPVALWFTLIAACIYVSAAVGRRSWKQEPAMILSMAAAFAVLGALPFVSVFTLDNQVNIISSGSAAALSIRNNFPGNFLPIVPKEPGLAYYQAGYALLGVLAAALLLLFRARPRGAWAFALAALIIPVFVVPVPWITDAFWTHVPVWFVSINNIWPMQRLFLVWSTLIAFAAAIILGSPLVVASKALRIALLAAFIPAVLWSAREARKIADAVTPLRSSPAETQISNNPENVILTRYEYSSFSYTPAYFSHGFMDSWLENRLLDFSTLEPLVSDSDAAAPGPGGASVRAAARMVQSGSWTGHSITGSAYYLLDPPLTLEAGSRYALRLEFLQPDVAGTIQFKANGLFREYSLPDSGEGSARRGASLAFGSGATNSHVIPLSAMGSGPFSPQVLYIARSYASETLPFARFWLYKYEPKDLPIAVESWIPYRARVQSAQPAFLETSRMWLKGWRATVNGHWAETSRSPQNLVMFPVGAGTSHVTLVYHAPMVLGVAFWLCAAGWAAVGILALCQLALWTAGRQLAFEGLGGVSVLGGFVARRCQVALRHKTAVSVILVCLLCALLLPRLRTGSGARGGSSGPIRIEFTLPYGLAGRSQPLLTTGRAGAGTIIFATYMDPQHIRIGADVWGSQFQSAAIEVDYRAVQSLVVSDTSLFPTSDPAVQALSNTDMERLRGELLVELNGRTVMQEPCNAYDTKPSEIAVGEASFGSITDRKFDGEIRGMARLPIPKSAEIAAGRQARLRLRFPKDRTGRSEPLLSLSSGMNSRVCYVTYLAGDRIRLTCWGPRGVPAKSVELTFDPEKAHDIEFHPAENAGQAGSFDVACSFDGTHVLGHNWAPSRERTLLLSGLNTGGAPEVEARFTGPELEVSTEPDRTIAETPAAIGPEHLVIRLSQRFIGRSEPLLTTGVTGAADVVFVKYVDQSHIRVGLDHWGYGGAVSDPIEIDYSVPHEVWISTGALYPAALDDAAWGSLDPEARRQLKSHVSVTIDGRTALYSAGQAYPSSPENVAVAANPVGGSTCDAAFTGMLVFAERAGVVAPPPLR